MADINIASPGASEDALRAALAPLCGWHTVSVTGSDNSGAAAWDHAVSGDTATFDVVGLAGWTDVRIVYRSVTKSVSGPFGIRVSSDNGSDFYDGSAEYLDLTDSTGATSGTGTAFVIGENATAARSGILQIDGFGLAGIDKFGQYIAGSGSRVPRLFVASTLALNALHFFLTAGGNHTGGKVWVMVR